MSRCLTPQKISLLLLTGLYCEAVLPRHATVPVLAFIAAEIVPLPPAATHDSPSDQSPHWSLSLHDFVRVAAPIASTIPATSLLDLFLKKLWAIDSLDALHAFFDTLPDLLAKPGRDVPAPSPQRQHQIRLSRTSPLGIFLRRANLEFVRLPFHETTKLWLAFLAFRKPSLDLWQQCNSGAPVTSLDANITELHLQPGDALARVTYGSLDLTGTEIVSTEDLERILSFQIDRLQRLGNRVPEDVKTQLRRMLEAMSALPSLAHFVSFFDAWRAGNYTSAFDSLHRYFDYTMQSRDKAYYHYALLHMAILQADFGCFSEAVAALNETIATARENHDMSCLNFSLSWLNHLAKTYPQQIKACGYGAVLGSGSERDGLMFLKSRAKEAKMWSLLSSTLLSEAKMHMSHGTNISRALENILQSAHLNIAHHIDSNISAQMLLQASIYARLGTSHLSNIECETLRECYGSIIPVEDRLRAACHTAHMSCQAGHFSEAIKLLDSIETGDHRTLKLHQQVTSFRAILKIKNYLRRSDTTAAAYLLRESCSFAQADPEITFQLILLEIELLISLGSLSTALQKVEDAALALREGDGDLYQTLRLQNIKALLYSKAGVPEKGFSVAVRAANSAHRAKLWPVLWEAVSVIAGVLVAVGEYESAKKLGDALIPQALECGDEALCARLLSTQADACMGAAGHEAEFSNERREKVKQAEIFITQAKDFDVNCFCPNAQPRPHLSCLESATANANQSAGYEKLGDVQGGRDMLAKKCIIAKLHGEAALSNELAQNYCTILHQSLENA
ncbi:anaphase-promoting complex protein [Saccharata proteae CBS 121410]|uniref:Anaphase-promoting complex subunit 5 n=1 Tax=Saccharata proteae CBS 121410 TaxID=1314787 RepID=A0A9P4HVL9_9PEZI|nr:anaphase-promoting complex protein [Saccharata proteae CBS 121410]